MIDKRMMYAEGQRVAKTMDGSRPGYRGSDYGDEAYSRGAYSPTSTGPDDRSSDLQTINHFINTGQEEKLLPPQLRPPPELKPREKIFQEFLDYRKPVKGYGLTRILGLDKGPMQAFSDFNASINRPFFEKVVRAGKIPGLNFGTVSGMTFDQLENAYQSYMTDRMSGKTDAYGNRLLGYGDKDNQGITSIYDPNMFVDETGEIGETGADDVDIFTSRYLQNQPDKIRSDIEEQKQNYYTV